MTRCLNPNCKVGEIIQGQYGAEGDDAFKARLASGYCRPKCRRISAPAKHLHNSPPLGSFSSANYEGGGKAVPKEVPERDAARLAFARSMPCFTCGAIEGIHAHHEQQEGHGVMGGKVSDRRSIPLCPGCHRLRHDTGRSFWGNVDVKAYIRDLNDAYDAYYAGNKKEGL